jgi:hypothetical protein
MEKYLIGGLVVAVFIAMWSWWKDVNQDVSWNAFWLPVRDTTIHGKPWMKVHLVAHLIGGMVAGAVLLGPWFEPSWMGEWWQRLIGILIFQVLWERIQHENWKLDGGSSAYPWWSFVWDVQITLVGWGIVEILNALIV